MALHPNKHRAQRRQNSLFLLDSLHCSEQQQQQQEQDDTNLQTEDDPIFEDSETTHLVVSEDEELDFLLSKERAQHLQNGDVFEDDALFLARTETVEWLLKVNAFHGFSSLTALLAINYLDRILSGPHFQRDKPWMLHLLAVTCISLAAKVEEIHVPLLLDLQVEDSKYIFEAKTIQRMEVLVLSALQWKMHPVTSVSFLGIFMKRLGLKNRLIQREVFGRCERVLLSLVSDSRSVGFLPSVMAVSAMASVVEEMGKCNPLDIQDRLLNALKITKERVKECCNMIMEVSKREAKINPSEKKKRKHVEEEAESKAKTESETESESEEGEARSPNGVIEANFSCESSNESWGVGTTTRQSSSSKRLTRWMNNN